MHYERVAFGQRREQAVERGGGFGGGEAGVFGSEPLGERGARRRRRPLTGRSKESLPRAWAASVASRMSSIVHPSRWASSAAVGTAAELARELLALAFDAHSAFLELARRADRPAEVAEVAPDLALDGRHGEGAKGGAVVGVKAIQGLDQTERRDLLQVLERHPVAAVKAPRDRVGEREMGSQQAFTGVRVAVLARRRESLPARGGAQTEHAAPWCADTAGVEGATVMAPTCYRAPAEGKRAHFAGSSDAAASCA